MIQHFLNWRFGIIVSSAAIAVVMLNWLRNSEKRDKSTNESSIKIANVEKKRDVKRVTTSEIIELPNPRWIKVGQVKELYYYPLKSGRGKELGQCQFTECGIAVINAGYITLRDRMFLIYNTENGKFVTGRNYPTLILVTLSAVDSTKVQLQAIGMPTLIFPLPKSNASGNVNCSMWWGEPIKCIDCGTAPAEWISKFLTGTKSGLRLGLAPSDRRNIMKGPWERFTKVYETLTNDDVGLFADIASYMLMSESSLKELNSRLDSPVSSLQFRPNIVVSGIAAFAEDNWEWIKIGEDVVIRNVKPCPRCTMTKIDPETGTASTDDEPLRTLRTFREQTDPKCIAVDGKAPILGIYCGLYSMGNVKINDDVFVHVEKSVCIIKI